ncbi:MAG TPA: Asp23/Gls24 family envelope stress response protein, partial [Ktedonobacterales bacterium]|nr:Asp23/Gls24 family envelope stress response protein [Ktedonobacterales bacterium]
MSTMHSGPADADPTHVHPRGQAPTVSEPAGKIEVSTRAIATVAGRAVAQCYGVVGIAARHPRFATVETLPPDQYGRGVEVRFADDHVTIDLYVVLEHGLRIS